MNYTLDNLPELAEQFQTFLSKEHVLNGKARYAAESYLMLSKKERIMKDVLPEAEKAITLPPYPALPDALVAFLAEKNLIITKQEAVAFLAGDKTKPAYSPPTLVAARFPIMTPADVGTIVGVEENQQPIFQLHLYRSKVLATAQWDDEKRENLVVAAGSTAALVATDSLHKGYRALRDELIKKNILEQKGDLFCFSQSYAFSNATQAAAVICGYPANGRTFWKDSQGIILGEYAK
ncbi:DUF4357 domain-containing protein [Hymenobacter algoricola]|uniref:DUF4357 domain-containing protein n=1 Tax=Hymenobacter algoricola TaxID=486267 RepID=A0ABP7NDF3_9BACT